MIERKQSMNRRSFLNLSATAGVGALALDNVAHAEGGSDTPRDFYELRTYTFSAEAQVAGFDTFWEKAAIPALTRNGVDTVGVFKDKREFSPAYVLMRHKSLETFGSLTARMFADEEFLREGAAFLDTTSYERMESSILSAFSGMPVMERPASGADRVLQLRTYESPSVLTCMKKVEMFNTKEIAIFRKTGLNPVFFGTCIAGAKMPNLTYMLAFENEDELKAAWKTFIADPEWKELSALPEYADDKILSGITNRVLMPTRYSLI